MDMVERDFKLLATLASGDKTIRDLFNIVGNNPAEYVRRLRRKGWHLPMEKVPHLSKEGRKGWHGIYSLSANDRQAWQALTKGKTA